MEAIHGSGDRGAPVLVAPDSFKGTYSAAEVAEAVAAGIEAAGRRVDRCPVADGGEGTLDALLAARDGRREQVEVRGPLGDPVIAELGLIDDGRTAVVEMAQASGLTLMPSARRDAEAASTRGTGELILAAVETGAERIMVTVGGSATTDGGLGAIETIGDPARLAGSELIVLTDVTVPFESAAEVFAPQKGADPAAVGRLTVRLDELAERYARRYGRDPRGRPMTGAAGGLSGGLWAAFGAEIRPGAAAVLDALGFDQRLEEAIGVVVGEGSLDSQSFQGKIVGEILARAGERPVFAVAGQVQLSGNDLAAHGLSETIVARDPTEMREAGRRIVRALGYLKP